MKILFPLDKLNEVKEIIKAGADELYCGILTPEWQRKYPFIPNNRRPGIKSSFWKWEELNESIRIAHSYHIPVFLTLNEHYYTIDQYPDILDIVERAIDCGIDAFIVSDLGLLLTLQELNIDQNIHISTGGTAFNSEWVKFYKELGASRVILPRHLTIEEIREIRKRVPDIELEVFILNSRCANVDGFCTFLHGLSSNQLLYKNACMLPYHISISSPHYSPQEMGEMAEERISWERQYIWGLTHIDDNPCGACALYEFNEMGITGFKVVGRGNPIQRKIIDAMFLQVIRNFLKEERPRKEVFRAYVRKLYGTTYGRPCRKYMCYYPSVMD